MTGTPIRDEVFRFRNAGPGRPGERCPQPLPLPSSASRVRGFVDFEFDGVSVGTQRLKIDPFPTASTRGFQTTRTLTRAGAAVAAVELCREIGAVSSARLSADNFDEMSAALALLDGVTPLCYAGRRGLIRMCVIHLMNTATSIGREGGDLT